jgi:hypothetical protein
MATGAYLLFILQPGMQMSARVPKETAIRLQRAERSTLLAGHPSKQNIKTY